MQKSRVWPAVVIVAAVALGVGHAWLADGVDGQQRTMQTGASVILGGILLLLWLLLFSRLSLRARLVGCALALGVVSLLAATFRVRGVTGDFVPIVESRFSRRPPLARAETASPAPLASPAGPAALGSPGPEVGQAPLASASGAPDPGAASPLPSAAGSPAPGGNATPTAGDTASYPRFLGTSGDATVPGPRLARDWTARPPRQRWRQPIGAAWSGFAVMGARAVTQEQRGPDEQVTAYDLATGRLLWAHSDTARYETTIAGVGPRATPSIADGRVFTMGGTGIVNALDLESGRRLWMHHALTETGGELPEWGKAASPLVVDGRVVVSAGGSANRSLVAYDANTGIQAWAAGGDRASYSSPRLGSLLGTPQILILNRATVAGHDPASGAVLWEHPFPAGQPNVASPAVLPGDRVLVSAGYGVGSRLVQLARDSAGKLQPSLVWESPRLKSKFANVVVHGQHVYGLDDGVLTCLDPATGSRVWKDGRYGHGQMILAGGLLLVQTEEGEIVLIDPSPEGLRELTRFEALEGKTWNPPALAGSLLLVRNDQEAAAYELPIE